jgi:glycosyltransferase involved in cell wall biosynthesis
LENKALSGLATRWAFWQLEGVQVKVLFVSDSLGCPIEQRGIHNFSMGLIENLQSIGAKVDLLVERPPTKWMAGRLRSKVVNLTMARKSIALGEVLRFFGERKYGTSWIHRAVQEHSFPSLILKAAGWTYVAWVRLRAGGTVTVENDPSLVDFVPSNSFHLAMPDQFVVTPAVYTEMVMRAAWGLPPDTIDARGYDLVIVDTPAYFQIQGIDSSKILSVIHDIIPLRDPMMVPYWRKMFFTKLEQMLAQNPNFAFVSNYSRNIFENIFPSYKIRHSFIYYPILRRSTIKRALTAIKRLSKRYAPIELANLQESVNLQDRLEAELLIENDIELRIVTKAKYDRTAKLSDAYVRLGWNAKLPYFVTVVSDEPRKNIGIFTKAFAALKGQANMVVLGNVDSRRYIGEDANAIGHIRFTGYIPESEKHRIIAMSDGMIFPSFMEGFGIPLIEGALFDKPVLCSDIDVFREVAGDDAFYFNPYREDSLVETVMAVLAAPLESHERALRLKGRVLEHFTIEAAAVRLNSFLREAGLAEGEDRSLRASGARLMEE